MTRRILAPALAVLAALTVLTGCMKGPTVDTDTNSGTTGERPAITEAVANYDAMLTEMRDLIAAEVPGGTWSEVKDGQTLGGDVAAAGDDATIAVSPLWGYDASFPSDAGARSDLIASLGAVGEKYGFSEIAVYVDRADEVQAVADDAFGAEYQVGSKKNSTLSYTTGSHPAD
jgi:hypothetical protein